MSTGYRPFGTALLAIVLLAAPGLGYAGPIRDSVQRQATREAMAFKQVPLAPVAVPRRPPRGGSLKVAFISAGVGCGFGAWVAPAVAERDPSLARVSGCALGAAVFGGLGFLLSMR